MAEALEGPLTPIQQRVLGALAEKAATVPDTYPMTLRGLQTACNQKNNREPVTEHTEGEVQAALDELKARHLVRFVYASHGARSTKFHLLDERLGLDAGELALVTALLLRGPQTLNELRTRTERAHAFDSNDEVASTLEGLAARAEPVVVHLPRQPGQKETRWAHLLGDGPDERAVEHTSEAPVPVSAPAGLDARVAELEERVAALEALLTDPTDPARTTEETSPT